MGGFLLLVKYLFFSKESPGPAAIQFGSVDKKANGESDADILVEKRLVQVERGGKSGFSNFCTFPPRLLVQMHLRSQLE